MAIRNISDINSNELHEYLPVSVLECGAKYQRPLDLARIQKYAETFDPSRLEIIDVAFLDDGTYEVVDGQHRVELVKLVGYTEPLLCKITIGLSYEQRAQRFVDLNKERKRPSALDVFWARHEAGDAAARDIRSIVESEGFRIARSASSTNGRAVLSAIGVVENAYRRDGGPVLRNALYAIREGLGTDSHLKGIHLSAVISFVSQYRDEFDMERLVTVLQGITPRRLESGVNAVVGELKEAEANYTGASTGGIFVMRLYNKGLRSRKMPAWIPGRHAAFKRSPDA